MPALSGQSLKIVFLGRKMIFVCENEFTIDSR